MQLKKNWLIDLYDNSICKPREEVCLRNNTVGPDPIKF